MVIVFMPERVVISTVYLLDQEGWHRGSKPPAPSRDGRLFD
jgi:hypothetical protein